MAEHGAAGLAVVAHPDDETVGLSTRLARWAAAGHVLTVTDGAPRDRRSFERHGFTSREAYAAARAAEQAAALAVVGVAAEHRTCLGVVDQEAALHLPAIVDQIATQIAACAPAVVFTHAYEGGHPDHDAVACAVHLAIDRLAAGRARPPALFEFAGYRADLDEAAQLAALTGPRPPRHQLRPAIPLCFLPGGPAQTTVVLSPDERARKRRMYACYRTQALEGFFTCELERFRPAPRYDFTRPPHVGVLHYEKHDYAISGERFRALYRAARAMGHGASVGSSSR
ncbi:MAG TPA: PIG-L family deacetylase [Kofleriaceae bacterium]|nr:PIG-L family deacetylase [Kofleriaceae bacterium]